MSVGPVRGEVMDKVVITIVPESPISSTWRLIHKADRRRRWLRKGGHVYGGTMRQAHEAAVRVAAENGFVYEPPAGLVEHRGGASGRLPFLPPGS